MTRVTILDQIGEDIDIGFSPGSDGHIEKIQFKDPTITMPNGPEPGGSFSDKAAAANKEPPNDLEDFLAR